MSISTETVWCEERERILGDGKEKTSDGKTSCSALCLSGGGIRSAAFSLGVLQALARGKLLTEFRYLSTVSGGGYIGAWLQALITSKDGNAAEAEKELADTERSFKAVGVLRRYTNFLTPDPSPMSVDSMTGVVLYLRNLLVTWVILLPLMMAATLPPILVRTFVSVSHGNYCLLILASVVGTWVVAVSALGMPGHRKRCDDPFDYLAAGAIKWWILYPFIGWLILMSVAVDVSSTAGIWIFPWPAFSHMASLVAGYGIAHLVQIWRKDQGRRLFRDNWWRWIVATLVSGLLIKLGMMGLDTLGDLYQRVFLDAVATNHRLKFDELELAAIQTLLLPLWLTMAAIIHVTVYIFLRHADASFELDREWLARLSGLKLRAALAWTLLSLCAIALPLILLGQDSMDWERAMTVLAPAASLSPLVAWFGKKITTRLGSISEARIEKISITSPLMLNLAAVVAIAALISLVSVFTQRVALHYLNNWSIPYLTRLCCPTGNPNGEAAHCEQYLQLFLVLALGGLFGLFLWLINERVNVNRFSMHAVYRNRLTRAFLGSPRRCHRKPDPFTDFDPSDNLLLSDLWSDKRSRCLFPVINLTLNITAPSRTDWVERKAMSFTVSPLHCGSAMLGGEKGTFVKTCKYGGRDSRSGGASGARGLSLATAMTISGAAASPHWGYNSSPPTAFLMTLFNLRLGAWLPNPARITEDPALNEAFPAMALKALTGDLLGRTSDRSKAIYLSDGGHFENLGVYEMLRRRCRWIVVVDASQDKTCSFTDLGNAIRKAEIDLPLRVAFNHQPRIYRRDDKAPRPDALGFALAEIEYLDAPPIKGTLLYIKPSLLPDAPMATRASAEQNPDFPHESTLDQWFSESQFESYRALGFHQASDLIREAQNLPTLFYKAAARYDYPPRSGRMER